MYLSVICYVKYFKDHFRDFKKCFSESKLSIIFKVQMVSEAGVYASLNERCLIILPDRINVNAPTYNIQ